MTEKKFKRLIVAMTVGAVMLMVILIMILVFQLISIKVHQNEIAILEELRAQSEKAEEQLEMYKGILPDGLGDIYVLEEDVVATCENFGLTVKSVQVNQILSETQETTFELSVEGTFFNIHSYMAYMSGLEQMHRFDSVSLSRNSSDTSLYVANIKLVVLSQNGAEGIVISTEA